MPIFADAQHLKIQYQDFPNVGHTLKLAALARFKAWKLFFKRIHFWIFTKAKRKMSVTDHAAVKRPTSTPQFLRPKCLHHALFSEQKISYLAKSKLIWSLGKILMRNQLLGQQFIGAHRLKSESTVHRKVGNFLTPRLIRLRCKRVSLTLILIPSVSNDTEENSRILFSADVL